MLYNYDFTKSKSNNLFINNMSGITYINEDIRIIQKDIITENGIMDSLTGLFGN